MVATLAVIGVAAYVHWDDVLKYTGSRVCSYNVLGKYASKPPKVPPIDLGDEAKSQPQKQSETVTAPSTEVPVQKVQTPQKAPPAPKLADQQAEQTVKEVPFAQALDAARKLFWANDPKTAPAYEELIARNPEDADLQAELGNVYFKLGEKDKAAGQYLKAGKLFARQKNTEKVSLMAKTIKKIAPEKAKELLKTDVKEN